MIAASMYRLFRLNKADFPVEPARYFRYSPLMGFFQCMVFLAWMLSLVEYVKLVAVWLAWQKIKREKFVGDGSYFTLLRRGTGDMRKARSWAIDFYEVLKWSIVILFVVAECQTPVALAATTYLLASNLFSHFYYHVWNEQSTLRPTGASLQSRRRFLSFVFALFFSFVGYSLYFSYFRTSFDWRLDGFSTLNSFFFSISNSFTLTYGNIVPADNIGYFLTVSQVVYTFFLIVIIVSQSLPQVEPRESP